MFAIRITKKARRHLNAMPSNVERTIIRKIRHVAADPLAPNNNVTALKGGDGFRLSVGDRRVLYTLDIETRSMTIAAILPRGDDYR